MFSAADLEGHDVDGVFYLLDFSRTFPPTAYDDRFLFFFKLISFCILN